MGHQLESTGRCRTERFLVEPGQHQQVPVERLCVKPRLLAPDPTRFQLEPTPQTELSQFRKEDCHAAYADRTASNE